MSRRSVLSAKSFCTATAVEPQKDLIENVPAALQTKDKLYSRLEIELKGVEPEVMRSYAFFATTAAQHLGIKVGNW